MSTKLYSYFRNRLAQPDFVLAIQLGEIPGFSKIDKFGENPSVSRSGVPEDVWEVGGMYVYDDAGTAPIQYVSSDDAADTGQLVSVEGLDIDGNKVVQEITTAGQANVTLSTPLWRCFRASNESLSGNNLAGMLYVHTDPAPSSGVPLTSAIRAEINNGNNQTLMAIYTVQKGKVGFLYKGEIGVSRSVAAAEVRASYYSRRFGKVFKVKKRVNVSNSGSSIYQDYRSFPDIIPSLTDIKLTVEDVSADNIGVFGTLDILLVDEDKFDTAYLQAIGQPGY